MQTFRKYLLHVVIGFIVLLGSLYLGRHKVLVFYYREKFKELPYEKKLLEKKKLFIEDRENLAKYEFFRPSRGQSDAGPFLNAKIHWEIGDIHHQGNLVLPEFIKKEMNKDWAIKKPLFKKMGLDFGWMKELLKYDYWTPDENSPAFPEGKKYLTYSFPVPSYRDLLAWAKLRLLYGRENKDIQSAFKEVRHLARLIWTNDYLVSNMVAVNMLKLEHQFHETLLHEEEGDWELIPEDAIMRAKRYFYAARGFTEIYVSDKTFADLTSSDTGLCSTVTEGLMSYISMRDLMKEELSDKYGRMDSLVQSSQKKCRKTIVHRMWEDPTWPSFMTENQDPFAYIGEHKILGKKLSWKELKESDELKVVMGYIFLTSSTPNYFSGYEEE